MPRDRIAEITSVKGRASVPLAMSLLVNITLGELESVWHQNKAATSESLVPTSRWTTFSVVRTVTALEVFTRAWTATLIDWGTPYAENAAALDAVKKARFDFALSRAIQGKQLSIGEIIAHEISTNTLEDVAGVLSTLIGQDLFGLLENAYDRFEVEVEGKPLVPIIQDVSKVRADLARLFQTRHILVHELPLKEPVTAAEARGFVNAAQLFVNATDAALKGMTFGEYPLTQAAMTEQAWNQLDGAERDLDEFIRTRGLTDDENWKSLRTAFEHYAEALSRWGSGSGSTTPMWQAMKKRALLGEFLDQMKRELG